MMEFEFEESPWELTIKSLPFGGNISAARFLTLLEEESEDAVEAAFEDLEQKRIALDIGDLPKSAVTGEIAVRLQLEQKLVQTNGLPAGLDENDPLRLYLEEVAQTPAAGDPVVLAAAAADGEEAAMAQLTSLMLSRVITLACEMTGRGVLLLDLIQEGSLGLWQAILQYQNGDFESQCDWWIRQSLSKIVTQQARSSGLGQKLRSGLADYRDVDQKLLTDLGRNPTLEEIAEQMHITAEEAAVYESMLAAARTMQQVKTQAEPKEENADDEQAVENTAYFQSRQRIMELLSVLSEEDAQLLSLRFGLEGGMPLNPREVGQKLGLTEAEVVARETAALEKMRQDADK